MGHAPAIDKVEPKKFTVSPTTKMIFMVMMGVGVASFAGALFGDKERAWHSYLTSYFYFASLGVGGLFFTAIQHATNAGWSVNIRRFVESFTSFVPVAFVGGLVLVVGSYSLYEWLDHDIIAKEALIAGKTGYLNFGFFVVRMIVFTALWVFFAKKIVGKSLKQDQDGDQELTKENVPWAVGFLLVFAISYSLFSVDTLMSLDSKWFSTMFGVYCFSGLFQSTLAFLILLILYVRKKGLVDGIVTIEHVHDLAKFLKGFTVFWAYIAFSQYMLIWYANLPEETVFFLHRSHGSWAVISISLIIFKFIVPFIALLPRWAKRSPVHLACVCVLILLMQFVDIYWMVYPNYSTETAAFSWQEVGVFIGFLGGFLFTVTNFLSKHSLVPTRDPRIHESLSHHVTY